MTRPTHCLSCGRPVNRYAATCQHCGAAQPQKRLGGVVGLVGLLLLLALTVVWALFGG
ncbi:hypothetical protein [Fodinicurvata sp. EGI_FJ10296]|uniref:hypothetical protein n=1 Tax=Fodinicurvata sp. EGI_FJ10296 TaxID=3231908 RepID=UPI003453D529